MKKNCLLKLSTIAASVLLLAACSGDSATADEQPEAAGDDWVDAEIEELDDNLTDAESRTERLAHDIELLSEGRSFSDVRTDHFAFEEIEYLTNLSIINGHPDGTFRPYDLISRSQTASMIVRDLGLEAPDNYEMVVTDVPRSHHNYDDLSAAEYHGVMTGNESGELNPSSSLTRSQMALVLVRAYAEEIPETSNEHTFTDMNSGSFAYSEVNRLADAGITTEVNRDFRPFDHTNRAQFSLFITRTIDESFR